MFDELIQEENFYDLLNVREDASKTQIREAYIRLRNTYDSQSPAIYSLISDDDASGMLTKIERAFAVLNDDIKRQAYDLSLKEEVTPPPLDDPFAGGFPAAVQPQVISPTPQPVKNKIRVDLQDQNDFLEQAKSIIEDFEPSDGTMYRKLRELANVSDEEMQSRTKVCIEYIRAIENNSFERLPKPVFVKGFLRSYFKYLSVPDGDRLAAAFSERLKAWQQTNDERKY